MTSLKRPDHPNLLLATLVVFAFLYFPLFVLVLYSFNQSRLMVDWQGFTTLWYRILLRDRPLLDSLANSLWVAFWTSTIALVLGVPAGVGLVRGIQKGRGFFEVLVILPLIVPEIVLAVAFAGFYGLVQLRLSFWTIVVTHVAFSLSYVILIVRSRMEQMDKSLIEAAMDLQAPESTVFFRVIIPHLIPAIISSVLIVFTISLDDYVITSFVAGVGNTTLPLRIYSMVKEGLTPEINAVCTALLVMTTLMIVLTQLIQRSALRLRQSLLWLAIVVVTITAPLWWHKLTLAREQRQTLNLFIWSGYLAPDTLKVFEQRFNASVQFDLYDSNEALLGKLQSGSVGYDVIVPTDYMIQILIKRALLSPIDKRQISNFDKNLDPRFLNRSFDPSNLFSVPYIWGTTGIGYRKDRVQEPVESWQVLWDERYRNKIVMLDDMRENFAASLKLAGFSLNSRVMAEVRLARDLLEKQKPLVRAYNSSNFQETLASGDAWLVQGYNGQIVRAAQENPAIGYCIPREGATLSIDSFCVPANAPHLTLAHRFINYMLEPETAAAVVNHTCYTVANRAAAPYIKKAFLNNSALFPDENALAKCEIIEDLGQAVLLYDQYWTEIKSR
jgi:spermidine/putrescine transport system substrate-binding protein/spermidine/putrescine transport system permease protein